MARKERYLVGLDVGTSKITAIVGETSDEGDLDIIGIGLADSKGIRRGVVVNLEAAVESIKKAIDDGESNGVYQGGDRLYFAVVVPVVKAFVLQGYLVTGFRLDDTLALDLKRSTGADVAYLARTSAGPRVTISPVTAEAVLTPSPSSSTSTALAPDRTKPSTLKRRRLKPGLTSRDR